ncbi:MAG: hypothetical protein QNJ41_00410 [Xenococcaceae cyanobacterium MO_188.B32]|nr:hypothetical protein [Xenococcaceae cyanobacterium MO_188.B32]
MSSLHHKRKQVSIAILATVFGTGVVTATPTPNLEISKQVFLTIANVAMCALVWNIYFDEELSKKDIISILLDLSIVTVISAFTAYVTAKGITALINDITNWLGVIGWVVIGIIAGLATSLLGIGWASYCDDLYRHQTH